MGLTRTTAGGEAGSASETGDRLGLWPVYLVALAALTLVLAAARWPSSQRFVWWGFCDLGCNLTLPYLIDQGKTPTTDFGSIYGLLAALVGDVWLRGFGASPGSFTGFVLLCNLSIAWSLVRFARAVGASAGGCALLVAALPSMLAFPQGHWAHALEPALMVAALAEHTRGNRPRALALLTACCFVKPSLSYVYGFILLVMTVRDLVARRASARAWAGALGPAVAVGLIAAGVLAVVFGPAVALRSAFPGTGLEVYRTYNLGFFHGRGRAFWDPTGKRPGYYLGTVAGGWILATLFLLPTSAAAAWCWLTRRGPADPRLEVIVACALIHVVFVTTAWGNAWSWYYYYYALILGVAAVSAGWRPADWFAWGLAVLAVLGTTSLARETVKTWRTTRPYPATAGLWATPEEAAEWERVRERIRGKTTVLLEFQGGAAERIFRDIDFLPPTGVMHNRGIALPPEIDGKVRAIAMAERVVTTNITVPEGEFLGQFPAFQAALAGFERIPVGTNFVVYERVGPTGAVPHERP